MATAAAPTQVPGRARWVRAARRRPALAVAALYAVLSLLMFLPGMVPGRTLSPSDYLWTSTPWETSRPAGVPILGSNREQTDSVKMFQPWLEETRRRLPDVPLWDPYIMGGRPLMANTQSAVFSPFSVPSYVLGVSGSLALVAALKVFLAALGTFAFARLLGLRVAAACFAGLVFGFGLWCVSWVSWTTMSVWALLPLVLALGEVVLRRPGPLPFVGLAMVVALQWFAGHPATSFQVLVPVVVLWAVRLALARDLRWGPALRRAAWLGGALAAGTALAAVMLIPFVELLGQSIDLQERSAHPAHQLTQYLLGVFLPDYWGRSTRGTLIEFPSALEERVYYLGALPLMLAVVALLRPTRGRVTAAAGALVALGVATGIPPFFQVVSHLPGFAGTNTWRLAVFTSLGGALLAGWGLEDLMRPVPGARRRTVVTALCAALVVLPLLIVAATGGLRLDRAGEAARMAWAFAKPDPAGAFTDRPSFVGVVRLSALLEWLLPAAVAVLLVVLRLRGRLPATAFAAIAVVLVVLDLFRVGMGYNPAIPDSHAAQPTTGAIRFLQAQGPERFVGLDPTIPLAVPVVPDVAIRYGLLDARGYDFPVEQRYAELWRPAVARDPGCNYAFCVGSVGIRPAAFRALGLFGVTHLVQNPTDPVVRGLPVAYAGRDARVYANPYAVPRAFLVDHQTVVADADAARAAITAPGFRPRATAVTERALPGLAGGATTGRTTPGTAAITRYEPERVVVRAQGARPSLLVLSDSFFPGWTATVDGRDAPVHRVDDLFRGVQLPAGAHTVEFRYRPASFRIGAVVTLLTLLGLAMTAVLALRAARAPRSRPGRAAPAG